MIGQIRFSFQMSFTSCSARLDSIVRSVLAARIDLGVARGFCQAVLGAFLAGSAAERFRILLCLDLHQAARTFFEDKFLLLANRRIGIDARQQITVTLEKTGGDGTKRRVGVEAVEDGIVCERGIVNNLAAIGRLFGDPSFQFHQEPGIFCQYGFDLHSRSSDTVGIVFAEFERLGRAMDSTQAGKRTSSVVILGIGGNAEGQTRQNDQTFYRESYSNHRGISMHQLHPPVAPWLATFFTALSRPSSDASTSSE